MIVTLERQQNNRDLLIAFLNPLSQCTKPKTTTGLYQSENEHNHKRQKKPLMLPSTRKRQNRNQDEKMAGANEKKAASQSLAAEEALLSIPTYKEGEMAAMIVSITSPNTKKSTAIVQHLL